MEEFSKVTVYRVKIQKSIILIHISKEQFEIKLKNLERSLHWWLATH